MTPALEPTSHAVPSTDGVTVAAHDYGGAGPALILCHATGFHGRYWEPIIGRLADHFRCIAIDLRGHGDSVVPDGVTMNWSGMASDVVATVDHLQLDVPLVGVGHSMGGASLIMAELERPGTFAAGWLFEPILPPSTGWHSEHEENGLAVLARKRREVFDSRDHAFERYASRPPFSMVDPAALRAYVDFGFRDQEDGTVILKCRGETEAQVFDSSINGAFERLDEVTSRLVIAASGDGGFPAQVAEPAVAALPNATLETYADLTHFGPMQDPQRISAAILDALG